jgi:hypothetical protein
VRIIPETANRDDWPRLVAQTVNALVRRVPASSGGALTFDGGSEADEGFFVMDGGGA